MDRGVNHTNVEDRDRLATYQSSPMDFRRHGFIKTDRAALLTWCREQTPTLNNSVSNYTVGSRKEKWFDKGWTLSKNVEIFTAEHDEGIYQLGQRLYPGNHACLFLYYPPGAYIKPHRDHTASEAWVVQVNLGCPVFLTVGEERYSIADGEVIGFNSKLLHSVSPAAAERPCYIMAQDQTSISPTATAIIPILNGNFFSRGSTSTYSPSPNSPSIVAMGIPAE